MSISMAIFTYLNAWWISLFLVLPFYSDNAEAPKNGTDYAGAPRAMRWSKIIRATSITALAATIFLAYLVHGYR